MCLANINTYLSNMFRYVGIFCEHNQSIRDHTYEQLCTHHSLMLHNCKGTSWILQRDAVKWQGNVHDAWREAPTLVVVDSNACSSGYDLRTNIGSIGSIILHHHCLTSFLSPKRSTKYAHDSRSVKHQPSTITITRINPIMPRQLLAVASCTEV